MIIRVREIIIFIFEKSLYNKGMIFIDFTHRINIYYETKRLEDYL